MSVEMVKLTELCRPKQWKTISGKDLLTEGYPVYGANGIIGYWSEYNHENETVTIACRGTCGSVGIVPAQSYINGNAMCLDNLSDKINLRFLYHYLRWFDFNSIITGTTIPQITIEGLQKVMVPCPSIEKQKELAHHFDIVEKLIVLRKEQLQKLDDLVKSRFVEMFGDPKINPYNYHVVNLGEHITFLTSGSRGWAKYCVENGKEWFITIKNVKDCSISVENMQSINAPLGAEAERTRVQEGDLLISITADLGRTGVVTKEIAEHGAYINQHLTCIRLDKTILNPLYVAYFMETPAGKEQFEAKNQSAVKAGLNFNSINSLRIMIPPVDKQNDFVTFVKHVDSSRLTIQKGLSKLELLKQSLMQKYFG